MRDFIPAHSDLKIDIISPYWLRAFLVNIYAIEGPLRGRSVYKVLIAHNIWGVIFQKWVAAEIWILMEAKGKRLNFVQYGPWPDTTINNSPVGFWGILQREYNEAISLN